MAKAKGSTKKAASTNGEARTTGTATAAKKAPASALQASSAAENNVAANNNGGRATDTSVYPSVSEEQIRHRAYELYVQRGGGHGRHVEDWFRAEAELRGRS